MAGFYPDKLADRVAWHANFSAQAAATGVARGLTAGQVTQIAADAIEVSNIVNYLEAVDAFSQAVTEYKNIMLEGDPGASLPPVPTVPATISVALGALPGIEARTRQFAGILRAAVGYTPEIGELYGIVAPAGGGLATPSLQVFALTASQVRVAISKGGYDVVAIDGRINGGAWTFLGIAQTAEYLDARAPVVAGQPELREYRAQGMTDNNRVGDNSAVAGVWTLP